MACTETLGATVTGIRLGFGTELGVLIGVSEGSSEVSPKVEVGNELGSGDLDEGIAVGVDVLGGFVDFGGSDLGSDSDCGVVEGSGSGVVIEETGGSELLLELEDGMDELEDALDSGSVVVQCSEDHPAMVKSLSGGSYSASAPLTRATTY